MPKKQRCPKCSHLNDLGAKRCEHCLAPLVQVCPQCGALRPWYADHCPQCETPVADAEVFTSLFRETPHRLLGGRYLVRETLATGQVSAVFRVTDAQNPSAEYAVKELSAVMLFRAQERREAESALGEAIARWSAVHHPAIAHIIDAFAERGKHYVVSEFVRGWSMRRIIANARLQVTPDLARNWGGQLCQLLEHFYTQEPPLHVPFLAPGHVMVAASGQVRLVDLGFTAIFAPSVYGPYGSVRGYAAPELASGPPTVRSDLFALGRLLYALLVGCLLEEGAPRRLPLQQAVPGISPRLVRAIARAAHRDPERRFDSAAELRHLLWDEALGPLTPGDGRIEVAPARPPAEPVRSLAEPGSPQSMADLGFTRDPRFGREATDAPSMPRPREVPSLAVQPRLLNLGELDSLAARRAALVIHNTGQVEVVGRVISHLGWVSAPAQAVRLPPGKKARVILTVRPVLAPSGRIVEAQALSVEGNAGRQWVGISLETAAGPALSVEQTMLDFGTFEGEGRRDLSLILANQGRGTLIGRVVSCVPWLGVPRGEFRCPSGESVRVTVDLLPKLLPRGEQDVDDALVIDSDGGQQRIRARAWRLQPELDLGAGLIDFGVVRGGEQAERYLFVGNAGDGTLRGAVRSLVPWLQASPQRVVCAPGELVQVALRADCADLPDGLIDLPQALRLETDGGVRSMPLRMRVQAPRLVLGEPSLDFGEMALGQVRERPLTIGNAGSIPMQAAVQSRVPWLRPSQGEVVLQPGQRTQLTVRLDTGGLDRGQEVALDTELQIAWSRGVESVPVSGRVLQPALRVEPSEVDFGYIDPSRPASRMLAILNDGTGELAWNAQTDAAWIEVEPQSGTCQPGESCDMKLTAYGLGLDSGVQSASAALIVNSDGGRAKVPLKVALASPLLAVDVTQLDLGTSVNGEDVVSSFRVFNRGLGPLRGAIGSSQTWLVVDRASFECDTGRSVEVRVSTDLVELPPGALGGSGLIRVESNGGVAQIEVGVAVELVPCLEAVTKVLRLRRREPDGPPRGRLVVRNVGRAMAHAQLLAGLPELVPTRSRLDIKPGKSARVAVRWEGALPPDPGRMYVDITGTGQEIRVPARIEGQALEDPAAT